MNGEGSAEAENLAQSLQSADDWIIQNKHQTSVSLICASLGNVSGVSALIDSIEKSDRDGTLLELIVVDQSHDQRLRSICSVKRSFVIRYLWSSRLGTSCNRNIGLECARSEYVAFPDDDCTYDRDFFSKLYPHLNARFDIVFATVLSIEDGERILRPWPRRAQTVSLWEVMRYVTCVSMICRRTVRFDESFGINARYHGAEDLDYAYRAFGRAYFDPALKVRHPAQVWHSIPFGKSVRYSFGLGAFYGKHLFPFGLLWWLTTSAFMILRWLSWPSPARLLRTVASIGGQLLGLVTWLLIGGEKRSPDAAVRR